MISLSSIYRAFGVSVNTPPHSFQIERVGEILLPVDGASKEALVAKRMHIIPDNAALPVRRIETIICACDLASAQHGPDLFASHDRAQNIRFHILSPDAQDESADVLQLLAKLMQYLSEQDQRPDHV